METSDWISIAALVVAIAAAVITFRQTSIASRANEIAVQNAQAAKDSARHAEVSASAAKKANEYAADTAKAAANQDQRDAERAERERFGWRLTHHQGEMYRLENTGNETAYIYSLEGSAEPRLLDSESTEIYPGGQATLILEADFPYQDQKLHISWTNMAGNYQKRVLDIP